ncbi:hypothetical protein [Butyrivibrio sp. VCB2001]|uniref:hypothetical protein n=1 Tax=Butyrivibrio sp. VCB2001 TaxID=1280667 RepID=UPI0003F8932B|nr:hypothetical protein [Butyrivibrio sp. VCB2001]
MNTNSENPKVGKEFEKVVRKLMEEYFGCRFVEEKAVLIGNPPMPHKFDMASIDEKIIVECKCYTWTKSGNVPSAKMATLDEAVLYMRSIPFEARKIIAIKLDRHDKREITLAQYFCDKKGHLLDDIEVWEVDDFGGYRILRGR